MISRPALGAEPWRIAVASASWRTGNQGTRRVVHLKPQMALSESLDFRVLGGYIEFALIPSKGQISRRAPREELNLHVYVHLKLLLAHNPSIVL